MKNKEGLHLFELIKTMTKSEKRFFKISAQKHAKHEESIYIKLFDAIEKQRVYNEKQIREMFIEETFIERLAMEKYNLYRILLRTLIDYNHETTADYRILEGIKSARILYSKQLFDQSKKILESIKRIAIKYDKTPMLIEILELERFCVNAIGDPEMIENELPELVDDSVRVAKSMMELTNYIVVFKDYMLASKHFFSARNNKEKNRIEKIFQQLVSSEDNSEITFEHFFRKNNLLSFYSKAIGDEQQAVSYCKLIIDEMENNPERIIENPERYATTIYNLILRCDLLLLKDESAFYYKKLQGLYSKYKIKENLHVSYVIFRLDLYQVNRCIRYADIKDGLKLINRIDNQLADKKSGINWENEALYHYNAAYLCFIAQDYKKSLKYINKILQLKQKNYRNDIFGYARIMSLILHYELDNADHISYTVRSTHRFLEKSEAFNQMERIIYKFISYKVPRIMCEREKVKKEAFIELREQITAVIDQPFEAKSLEYFDMISGVDRKISKKEFALIMKEKFAVTA